MSDWAFTRLGTPEYCESVPKKLHMGAGASMSLGTHPVLNPRDARREGLVVGVNVKALFLGIQVLLNAVSIFLGPFIDLAISHKVIVGEVGRAVGVVGLLVVCRVVGVGDCHELVGQAKVQMTLVQVSVPVVVGVVPG